MSTEARSILESPSACAEALLIATKMLLPDCYHWEPESIWIELARKGLKVPEVNHVKIQAALTLVFVPSFYWDGVIFEKTALAFDDVVPNPAALEEATSAQLAWAVDAAAHIDQRHALGPHRFQHEPATYAAIVLHREGFVWAPSQLAFAQEQLDSMITKDAPFQGRVKTVWEGLKNDPSLAERGFAETPLDVQLARLAAVELHVRDKQGRRAADLSQLKA